MADDPACRGRATGMTRAFIAIELPADVKGLIATHIGQLKCPLSEGVKWVDPGIAHLTLAFLGNVPDTRFPVLSQLTDTVAASYHTFTLKAGPLGAFPTERRARVVWMGIAGETRLLSDMQLALQTALQSEGFASGKRSFKPHVTLGRARAKCAIPLKEDALNLQAMNSLEFDVREIVLMSSVLTPRGPIHTPVHRALMSSEGSHDSKHS